MAVTSSGARGLDANIALDRGRLHLEAVLQATRGETIAVVGPNGAGKSTLLLALAGLLPLSTGRVSLSGRTLEDTARGIRVPPERRPVGVVFQEYLLFPKMSVLDNLAFGLRARGGSHAAADEAARIWLERLRLSDRAGARPHQLSGGEQQRVALARALITEPELLLLDEPLAALDAGTRARMRRDLRSELAGFDGVRLVVTHDPLEAMLLGDRVMVVEDGSVVQSGAPADIRLRPRSRYVADLVGVNLLKGCARGGAVELEGGTSITIASSLQGDVLVRIDPRSIALFSDPPAGSPRNVWHLQVGGIDDEGDRVRIQLTGGVDVVAEVTPSAVRDLHLEPGRGVWAAVKATQIDAYPV